MDGGFIYWWVNEAKTIHWENIPPNQACLWTVWNQAPYRSEKSISRCPDGPVKKSWEAEEHGWPFHHQMQKLNYPRQLAASRLNLASETEAFKNSRQSGCLSSCLRTGSLAEWHHFSWGKPLPRTRSSCLRSCRHMTFDPKPHAISCSRPTPRLQDMSPLPWFPRIVLVFAAWSRIDTCGTHRNTASTPHAEERPFLSATTLIKSFINLTLVFSPFVVRPSHLLWLLIEFRLAVVCYYIQYLIWPNGIRRN